MRSFSGDAGRTLLGPHPHRKEPPRRMATQDTSAELHDLLLASGLFDAEWYRRRYADVDPSELDPLEHFLSFGMELGRDPGPDHDEMFLERATPGFSQQGRTALVERLRGRVPAPRAGRALQAAAALAEAGRYEDAIRLGRQWLEPRDRGGLLILQANQALLEGSRAGWLAALNGYLAPFGMAPIRLRPAAHLLARLCTAPLPPVRDDAMVSVIMAAWNAEATVGAAIGSILDQSWKNLELLVVDDASSDGTWQALQRIAARDNRVRVMRNARNVGPYASKNLALRHARGTWVTGQDADDWSHPQRIERQVRAMEATGGAVKAGSGLMIRMSLAGHFGAIGAKGPASVDGVMRNALISCMFDREVLERDLGNWDSVRFGADAEMMHRARHVLGDAYRDMPIFTMLCLDHPGSLTGATGDNGHPSEMSPVRAAYLKAFQAWHAQAEGQKAGLRLACPLHERPFDIPAEMVVPVLDVEENMRVVPVEGDMQETGALPEGRHDHNSGQPSAESPDMESPDTEGGDIGIAGIGAAERAEEMLLARNRLEQQLAAERSRTGTLAEEVRRLTARLIAADKGLSEKAVLEAELERAVAARTAIKAHLDADIARLSRMVIDAQDRTAELEEKLACQDKAGLEAELERAVADRAAIRAQMSADIARLSRMVIDAQDRTVGLKEKLARRDGEAARMTTAIAAHKDAKRRAEKLVRQLEEQLSQTRAAFRESRTSGALLAKQARKRALALEEQLSQTRAALQLERKGRQRAREKIAGMERSLSWRMTRPIRFLRRILGRTG